MSLLDERGWKWIGAPHNGVLGLFPTPSPADDNSPDHQLHNKPTHITSAAVKDEIIHPPVAIRLVFLAMELVMAHAAGMLAVWCGSITKTITLSLTASIVLAEAAYCAVVCYGVLLFTTKIFQQHGLWLFAKRMGLFRTPVAMVAMNVAVQSLLFVLLVSPGDAFQSRWPLPRDDQSIASALRAFVFVPLQEELFFRGLVLHLALNRLHPCRSHGDLSRFHPGTIASVIVSSVCFAGVHLANLRHTDDFGVTTQLVWGLALGFVWGIRVVTRGSLLECVVLHTINNVFAALSTAAHRDGLVPIAAGFVMLLLHYLAMGLTW